MALVALPGGFAAPFGIGQFGIFASVPQTSNIATLDAANEAIILIGDVVTSDGASHTIDTTGSSSLQWRTGSVTFANAATTVVVGLGDVDTATGPPARAANATDVITFDVLCSMTGGGGGVTANAWQTNVPTSGTKTIANGNRLAFSIQMTARGGADSLIGVGVSALGNAMQSPLITTFLGGVYAVHAASPAAFIVFSDGAFGWFYTTDVMSGIAARTFNSGSATKEYGQLYSLPFPARISGLYGWIDPDADCDIVLYSDPLGTPVAQKTVSIDVNVTAVASGRKFNLPFPAAYDLAANTPIAAVFKPGGSNISAYFKTLGSATHRVTDSGGTSSYGVSRASGAFADANSSLDHYYIGLLLRAFDDGAGGGGGAPGHGNMTGGLQ